MFVLASVLVQYGFTGEICQGKEITRSRSNSDGLPFSEDLMMQERKVGKNKLTCQKNFPKEDCPAPQVLDKHRVCCEQESDSTIDCSDCTSETCCINKDQFESSSNKLSLRKCNEKFDWSCKDNQTATSAYCCYGGSATCHDIDSCTASMCCV